MNALIILQVATVPVKETAADVFFKHDPTGLGMTLIAMTVVFASLAILYIVFKQISKLFTRDAKRRTLLKEGKVEEAVKMENETSGELNAAIALALYYYTSQLHDYESLKITMNKVSRTYSPWSSKIYTLREWPVLRR